VQLAAGETPEEGEREVERIRRRYLGEARPGGFAMTPPATDGPLNPNRVPPTDLHPGRPQREKMMVHVLEPSGTYTSHLIDPDRAKQEFDEIQALHPQARLWRSPSAASIEANIPKGAT
jgi:hypothetical protein